MLIFSTGYPAQDTTNQEPKLKLIALKFYADQYQLLKLQGPIFTDLSNKFDNSPVLFVTLDFTNKTTKKNANLTMQALGLGSQPHTKAPAICIVDAEESRKVLETFTVKLTLDEMCSLLKHICNTSYIKSDVRWKIKLIIRNSEPYCL